MGRELRAAAFGLLIAVALALPCLAVAHEKEHGDRHSSPRGIPEFDPTAVGAIAALVAGGGILLARRRRG